MNNCLTFTQIFATGGIFVALIGWFFLQIYLARPTRRRIARLRAYLDEIDRTQANKAHPDNCGIVGQLPSDARMLGYLKKKSQRILE